MYDGTISIFFSQLLLLLPTTASAKRQCILDAKLLHGFNYSTANMSRPTAVTVVFDLELVQRIDQTQNLLTLRLPLHSSWVDPGLQTAFEARPECDQLLFKRIVDQDPVLWLPGMFALSHMFTCVFYEYPTLFLDFYLYRTNEDLGLLFERRANLWAKRGKDARPVVEAWLASLFHVYCPMQFAKYPMDEHTCTVQIGSEDMNSDLVVFEGRLASGELDPNEFYIDTSPALSTLVSGSHTSTFNYGLNGSHTYIYSEQFQCKTTLLHTSTST